MEVKIETATITLLDNLFEIEEQCFDQEAFTKRQISYLLTDYNTIALVAKTITDIAGFVIAQVEIEENPPVRTHNHNKHCGKIPSKTCSRKTNPRNGKTPQGKKA